ncbi:hypothetical protein FNV43_RR23232 [Rhamnella rubrinervis]|uniref:Lysine-specific demethylase JMJ16 n=1 Tax=Rhamnella rubrinervis TaxID=2594499 RepID=A0A8K0DYI7_9ROSA|nr:hypothetical protein FNV43_RR23232 [Rhamnella rubrinervis]
MSKKRQASHLSNENVEDLSVPPGFVSLTSFTLKRVGKIEEANISKDVLDAMSGMTGNAILKRTFRQTARIVIDPANHNNEESDIEQCDKVTARWRPADAITDVLREAPVFHPTEEEFRDTIDYVAKIRPLAETNGICRIVPPSSWNPPETDISVSSTFITQIQRIDGVEVPCSQNEKTSVSEVTNANGNKKRSLRMGLDFESGNGHAANLGAFGQEPGPKFTFKTFKKYADDFKGQYFCKNKVRDSNVCSTKSQWEPSVENIEGEYKRIIENPTEEIEVLCGDNLDPGVFGCGFPTETNPLETSRYPEDLNSGWNLNNLARLPASLLSFESNDTSHILVPRARIGMCFSSLQWRVAEHHLYTLSYMHMGAPKIWYCIPAKYSTKFEAVMKKLSPDTLEAELPRRLAKLVSPSILKSEGIPVFRCIHYPGEYVLVFPGAYHSGFDCGFNCSEEANFAPLDWLPHGRHAVENYQVLGRKTSISHDKLLLAAVQEAVRAQWEISWFRKSTLDNLCWKDAIGKEGILAKAFKSRIKHEGIKRKYLCSLSQSKKMDKHFDTTIKRECSICLFDLHMSAAGCPCSADRYSCLNHAKQLCSCPWSQKYFLFRHEISELNLLLEALGGKLSSMYKWAREYLGLSLSSNVSKNSLQASTHINDPTSHAADNSVQKVYKSQLAATPIKTSSSLSRFKAEIKARVLQSIMSNKSKAKEINETDSPNDAATASGNGGSSASSFSAEMKACEFQPSMSNEGKAKDYTGGEPQVLSSATKDRLSFLQIDLSSLISSDSASESSSSESEDSSDFGFQS